MPVRAFGSSWAPVVTLLGIVRTRWRRGGAVLLMSGHLALATSAAAAEDDIGLWPVVTVNHAFNARWGAHLAARVRLDDDVSEARDYLIRPVRHLAAPREARPRSRLRLPALLPEQHRAPDLAGRRVQPGLGRARARESHPHRPALRRGRRRSRGALPLPPARNPPDRGLTLVRRHLRRGPDEPERAGRDGQRYATLRRLLIARSRS